MSTIFTLNPIKLNIISIKNRIKKTIVFIGTVPKDVRNELIKIESSGKYNPKNHILTKFYDKNWDIRLGIKKIIKGGDNFDFDENSVDLDEIQTNFNDLESTTGVESIDNSINENMLEQIKYTESTDVKDIRKTLKKEISNDVENIISFEELSSIDTHPLHIHELNHFEKIQQITDTGDKLLVHFIFDDLHISIYPEDKIFEFKKKIYAILEIPIFRQHIWYVYQGRTVPLNYSLYENNSLIYINVQDMLNKYNDTNKQQQLIENIPINTKYYQNKSYLKIVSNDTFSLLNENYHKYGITEYNLLDLDDFVKPVRKNLTDVISDVYQLELIYYSFILIYWPMLPIDGFVEYVKSPTNIPKIYPEIQQHIQEIQHMYKLEKKIIDEKADLLTNPKKKDIIKKIRGIISNSITESIISMLKYQDNGETFIYIRNLFDKFPLSDKVISSKCYIIHNNKRVILNKVYKNNPFCKEVLSIGSILFKIRVDKESHKTINIIFFENGNYVIKSKWGEEKNYDFDDIFSICHNLTKPIIDTINSFGASAIASKKHLPTINKHNSKFTEIGMSMFYKKAFTQTQFGILKNIMSDYRKAGIVNDRSVEKSVAEYYFTKGMYQYNSNRIERVISIKNYYDFLTDGTVKQKWNTIFEKTRITKILHRYSDIKIEINGIRENEFFVFYNFIITLFHLFNTNCTENKICRTENTTLTTMRKLKKTLRNLKEQDPVLYNFRKKYKTENVYSKICQKSYQPLLLNKQGYDDLPKNIKKNAVKYWNFSTNKDAYYSCPNPKYPYIKFIVNRHPKDFCIPCCKKMQVMNSIKDAKRILYDTCLKTHKYEKIERTITLGSRYIMTYGKDIESGRLSRLPEESLEPLLYESYSIQSHGIDQECITSDGYYLYGIDQNIKNIKNVGFLNILLHATESNLPDFINKIINLIKMTPNKFRIILDGSISKYFKSINDFISQLRKIFIIADIINEPIIDVPWNEIFINIAYLFLNINVVYFKHSINDVVKFILPSYISNKDQFLSDQFINLIILQKRDKLYPIYLLNTDIYFKVKVFKKKLFNFNDSVIIIIGRLVDAYFKENIKKNIYENINLSIIKSFIKDTTYQLQKIFINKSNLCYYIHMTNKDKNIYMPIELSYHLTTDKINISYEPFSRNKAKMNIHTFMHFMKDFNKWIAEKSEKAGMLKLHVDVKLPLVQRVQPIYPYIKINSWLVLSNVRNTIDNNSNVIGFVSHNINYYINTIKLAHALKIKNVPITQLFYDPYDINRSIYIQEKCIVDTRVKNVGRSIYKSNLYQILLLEFMTIFNNQKNTQMRKTLKKLLLHNFNKDFDELMADISTLIPDCDDYHKIKTQICDFINNQHTRNKLFQDIDESSYKFDRKLFDDIKKLPKDKIYKELKIISNKFVTFGDINKVNKFDFPNMFITCQGKNNEKYCKNKKLIIDKTVLKNLLEIMTADILNPVKEKWLFSTIFSNNNINFYKFIKRPNEFITIVIVD